MKFFHKRFIALAAALTILACSVSSCTDTPPAKVFDGVHNGGEHDPIPLSGFEDITDENGSCTYQMTAELSDTYTFTCEKAAAIKVVTPKQTFDGTTRVNAPIEAGDTVTVTLQAEPFTKFNLQAQADNHLQRVPYTPHFTVDPATLDTQGDGTTPAPAELVYKKREGGTYVYLNNPEKLQPEDVGQAILRDEGLAGDVQVTWEHSNFTNQYITLGYQLKNEGDEDVYVTVTNIGYQIKGEWLGQQSWSDYYNYKFELPEDYFNEGGAVNERYWGQDFIDYTPRVFQPTTYRIPAGKYIWVLGGTSADAHNNTNVAQTADKIVLPGKCTNAVAKFFVAGGEVTGTFYCYTNYSQIQNDPPEQGYILERDGEQYGLQYKGVDYHKALIESNPVFYINDSIKSGARLPVTFDYETDDNPWFGMRMPYAALSVEKESFEGYSWSTNISPHGRGAAVGVDMSSFECVTTNGKTVTVDVNHRDGTGGAPNLGNWMIDYHDNMTFVNQGDRPRTVTINKEAQGALMTMIMDPEGTVLSTKCTIVPLEEPADYRQWSLYSFTIPPHSTMQLCASFLLMGNSYGNVTHWITVV